MSAVTQAYVNFYSAIGTLCKYVEMDANAKEIAKKQNLTIRFDVKGGGPDGILEFKDGAVSTRPYDGSSTSIHLISPNPDYFNKVVDGKATPIPVKGIFKTLSFMNGAGNAFSTLTDEMGSIMRTGAYLDGTKAKDMCTILSFYAMVAAIAQIGNVDKIGKVAASRIPDGEASMQITGHVNITIKIKDHKLSFSTEPAKNPTAFMIFEDLDTAAGLISGELDAMACLAKGTLTLKGLMPIIDNVNKILNVVPTYLS